MFYGVNENERRTQLRLFPSRRYTAAFYGETRVSFFSISFSLSIQVDKRRLDTYFSKIRVGDTLDGCVRKVCKLGSRTVTCTLPSAKETVIERTIIYRMF